MDKVFKELKDLKISNVQRIRVDHSKIEEFKKEVGKMAMKAAKDKAEYLLDAIGSKIGAVIYVRENGAYVNSYDNVGYYKQANVRMEDAYGSNPVPVPLDFKKIKLTADVFVKFEIK